LNWPVLAAGIALLGAMWWILKGEPPKASDRETPSQPTASASAPVAETARPAGRRPIVEKTTISREPPGPFRGIRSAERSLAELERALLLETNSDTQLDLIKEIAGRNDTEAVQSLARIFPQMRKAELKEAVLACLADIDPEAAPEVRLTLLEGALHGQARNVRFTAVDVLGHSDDPRARAALRRVAREDPDALIREAATAIMHAVEADAP
jgi:hypothetical protein